MDTQLEQAIRRFVVDTFLFGKGGETLGDQDSLLDRGIIDSTGVLELVAFIEGEFGIVVEQRGSFTQSNCKIEIGNRRYDIDTGHPEQLNQIVIKITIATWFARADVFLRIHPCCN